MSTQVGLINGGGDAVSAITVDGSLTYALFESTSFVGTVLFRVRPYRDIGGADFAGNDGYVTVATLTAATNPATDSLTTNLMAGAWQGQLYCSAYTSGSIKAAVGGSVSE